MKNKQGITPDSDDITSGKQTNYIEMIFMPIKPEMFKIPQSLLNSIENKET